MVTYSEPITPPPVRALIVPDPLAPKGLGRVMDPNVPEPGTDGVYATEYTSVRQALSIQAHGLADTTDETGSSRRITAADLSGVVADIAGMVDPDSLMDTRQSYDFHVSDIYSTMSVGAGEAFNPSYILPAWPEEWRNLIYDPGTSPPENWVDYEVLTPGRVLDAYLVVRHTTTRLTNLAAAYVTVDEDLTNPWSPSGKAGDVLDMWGLQEGPGRYSAHAQIDPGSLPLRAYVISDLCVDPYGTPPWPWRFQTGHQTVGEYEGNVEVLLVFNWQSPTYRWVLSKTPRLSPLRQYPRSDGLRGSTARRNYPPTISQQASNRRAGGYY